MKKRLLITFLIVLVFVIAMGTLCIVRDAFNPSELPIRDKAKEMLGENYFEWYDGIISQMRGSKSSYDSKEVAQEYIIADSQSFRGIEFINIRIYTDNTGKMIRKFKNSESEAVGEVIYDEEIILNTEQVAGIISLINDNSFWDIPTKHPEEKHGLDGNTIFIEGICKEKYNIISMWCPDEKYEIAKIYKGIIDYANQWGLDRK